MVVELISEEKSKVNKISSTGATLDSYASDPLLCSY